MQNTKARHIALAHAITLIITIILSYSITRVSGAKFKRFANTKIATVAAPLESIDTNVPNVRRCVIRCIAKSGCTSAIYKEAEQSCDLYGVEPTGELEVEAGSTTLVDSTQLHIKG